MAKPQKIEEPENHERWLVSYADFITLLFAFFTVLYATSEQNVRKAKEFEDSIRKYMGSIIGGSAKSAEAPVYERNRNFIESPIETFPRRNAGTAEVQDYVERFLKKNLTKQERKQMITEVSGDPEGVRIRLSAAFVFPSGSAVIRSEAIKGIEKISQLLKQSGREIVIEGHTDNEQIKTTQYPSNWELSSMRATKVVRYLTEREGVNPAQISAEGFADQRPIADNNSAEGRAKNRRIEILISNHEAEQ